ncbi:MAG TPA: hypothetical protein VGJ21_08670 [Terracidiphilus sp.]|jgi:hypothetical protein
MDSAEMKLAESDCGDCNADELAAWLGSRMLRHWCSNNGGKLA